MHTTFWQGDLKGRDLLEDLDTDGKTIFFFYLGPVCLCSGFKHRSLVAYCATLNCHSARIQYPCVSYKETEVLN